MGKVSSAWKELERTVAKKLGGKRIVRGNDFSQTLLDIEHPFWAIDCKWRSSLATVTWYKKLVKDTKKLYGDTKIPILVIKEKGMIGELVVIGLEDFLNIIKETYVVGNENM